MEQLPIQGGVEIFLIDSSSYRSWYKLQPGGSLGSYGPMEGRWKFQGKYNYVWSLTGELCIIIHMGTVLFQENIHSHLIWNLDREKGSKEEKTEIDFWGGRKQKTFQGSGAEISCPKMQVVQFYDIKVFFCRFAVYFLFFFNSCL